MGINLKQQTFTSPKFRSVVAEAVEFFLDTPLHLLPPDQSFAGAGVYALFYCGKNPIYKPLSKITQKECDIPIYVGKAVPPGWRTARAANLNSTADLFKRLCEHARSIKSTNNLKVKDFKAKFIILRHIEIDLITSVEAALIRKYKPIWNSVIDGFGNHDPGRGRYDQALSEWDTIHPGRPWATKLRGKKPNKSAIKAKISSHLSTLFLL